MRGTRIPALARHSTSARFFLICSFHSQDLRTHKAKKKMSSLHSIAVPTATHLHEQKMYTRTVRGESPHAILSPHHVGSEHLAEHLEAGLTGFLADHADTAMLVDEHGNVKYTATLSIAAFGEDVAIKVKINGWVVHATEKVALTGTLPADSTTELEVKEGDAFYYVYVPKAQATSKARRRLIRGEFYACDLTAVRPDLSVDLNGAPFIPFEVEQEMNDWHNQLVAGIVKTAHFYVYNALRDGHTRHGSTTLVPSRDITRATLHAGTSEVMLYNSATAGYILQSVSQPATPASRWFASELVRSKGNNKRTYKWVFGHTERAWTEDVYAKTAAAYFANHGVSQFKITGGTGYVVERPSHSSIALDRSHEPLIATEMSLTVRIVLDERFKGIELYPVEQEAQVHEPVSGSTYPHNGPYTTVPDRIILKVTTEVSPDFLTGASIRTSVSDLAFSFNIKLPDGRTLVPALNGEYKDLSAHIFGVFTPDPRYKRTKEENAACAPARTYTDFTAEVARAAFYSCDMTLRDFAIAAAGRDKDLFTLCLVAGGVSKQQREEATGIKAKTLDVLGLVLSEHASTLGLKAIPQKPSEPMEPRIPVNSGLGFLKTMRFERTRWAAAAKLGKTDEDQAADDWRRFELLETAINDPKLEAGDEDGNYPAGLTHHHRNFVRLVRGRLYMGKGGDGKPLHPFY